MEKLLHYIWKYKLFPLKPLQTTDGLTLEVIDPGTLNRDAGPDFFNAKIKLDGTTWVGNIEIHGRAADWYAHGHHEDTHYNNVILHVTETADRPVVTQDGKTLPQLIVEVPGCAKTTKNCAGQRIIRDAIASFPKSTRSRCTVG